MAAPAKKRDVDSVISKGKQKSNIESSGEESDENEISEQGMEIQVDFEGRNPQDIDYYGIKTLLKQLFLKARIDLGGLTDLIISQNYVGSVVKQSHDDTASDDEDDSANDVFGITTIINISERQNLPCIQQLRELLTQIATEHATDSENAIIKNLLSNDSASLGLLINERFVNIPAQISVPLIENLISEMRRAVLKNMAFDFAYFVLICKLYKNKEHKKHSRNKKGSNEEPDVIWSNPEEELFAEEATLSFEFSVEKESDSGLSGTWEEDDDEMVPYRRVLLFESSKLQQIVDKIKSQVS